MITMPVKEAATVISRGGPRSIQELTASASASRLSCFHQCRLKFYFRYVPELACPKSPEVLQVRLRIYETLEKWELLKAVGKKLAEYEPGNAEWWNCWVQATSKAESIEAMILVHEWRIDAHASNKFRVVDWVYSSICERHFVGIRAGIYPVQMFCWRTKMVPWRR